MCGWPSTSDPAALLTSLHRQPLLAVLRPTGVLQARRQLEQLLAAGLVHVELAVSPSPPWVAMVRELIKAFPGMRLGAASVCTADQLAAVQAAGLAYAVSPILDPRLLAQAQALGLTLVPGVFTPTEIAMAVRAGAPAVKLFPAAALGPGYWRSLAGPLGPLPFCIAAGGLSAADVPAWLAGGVDAVALGNSLFADASADGANADTTALLKPDLAPLLARLANPADRQQLST